HDPPHELRTNAAIHSFSSPVSSVALADIRGFPMRTCCSGGRLISAGAPPTFPAEAHAVGARLCGPCECVHGCPRYIMMRPELQDLFACARCNAIGNGACTVDRIFAGSWPHSASWLAVRRKDS